MRPEAKAVLSKNNIIKAAHLTLFMDKFRNSLNKFSDFLSRIGESHMSSKGSSILDYDSKKREYEIKLLNSAFLELKESSAGPGMDEKSAYDISAMLRILSQQFSENDIEGMKKTVNKIKDIERKISYPAEERFRIKNIPNDISDDVGADIKELEKCFGSGCYRASVILCGRLLETFLHRKYFEATGLDLLEKSPGIGLGSLIAKLKEKEVDIDPAIMQQIHLVNQVRIFSVHKKAKAFVPTQDQAHAVILYTLDVIRRI